MLMLSLLKRHFEKFQSSHSHNQNDKDTIPRTNSQGRSWRKLNVLLPAHLKSKVQNVVYIITINIIIIIVVVTCRVKGIK